MNTTTAMSSGGVRNSTTQSHRYVQTTFKVYDFNDALVGNAWDSIAHLGPREIWSFRAISPSDNIQRFQLVEIAYRQ